MSDDESDGAHTLDLIPDGVMIAAFCRWWFEHVRRGVMEIGWIDAATGGLTRFEQFGLGDVDALAVTAAQANLVPGQSCYIRAATVRPWDVGGARGHTSDRDFVSGPGLWGDIDTLADFERARSVVTPLRPNGQVITGTVPWMRVQSFFRASEPIVASEMLRSMNVRLHGLYGGDPSVVNVSRLMRLAGTIAWPRKAGRVAELTRFVLPAPEDGRPRSYPVSMLASLLPEGPRAQGERERGLSSRSTSGLGIRRAVEARERGAASRPSQGIWRRYGRGGTGTIMWSSW